MQGSQENDAGGAALRGDVEHAIDEECRAHAAKSEVVRVYAHRHQIPNYAACFDRVWADAAPIADGTG